LDGMRHLHDLPPHPPHALVINLSNVNQMKTNPPHLPPQHRPNVLRRDERGPLPPKRAQAVDGPSISTPPPPSKNGSKTTSAPARRNVTPTAARVLTAAARAAFSSARMRMGLVLIKIKKMKEVLSN
jgi:hypothetical protein